MVELENKKEDRKMATSNMKTNNKSFDTYKLHLKLVKCFKSNTLCLSPQFLNDGLRTGFCCCDKAIVKLQKSLGQVIIEFIQLGNKYT